MGFRVEVGSHAVVEGDVVVGVVSWMLAPVRVLLVLAVAALVSWAVFRRLTSTQPAQATDAGTVALPHSSMMLTPPVDDGAAGAIPAADTAAGDPASASEASVTDDQAAERKHGAAALTAPPSPAQAVKHFGHEPETAFEVAAAVSPMVAGPVLPSPSPSLVRRSDLNVIRVWAREHGYTVADRGRIAAAVIAAYDEAQ